MDVGRRRAVIEKDPPRHRHVAERIACRNEALVADEPVHAVPRNSAAIGIASRAIDRAASGSIRRSGRSRSGRHSRRSAPCTRSAAALRERRPRSATAITWRLSCEAMTSSELAPAAAVALQQVVRALRALAAGLVEFAGPWRRPSSRRRGTAAPPASRPRRCRRAGTGCCRRSCSRRSASHSRSSARP